MFFLTESVSSVPEEKLTLTEAYLALAEATHALSVANENVLMEDWRTAVEMKRFSEEAEHAEQTGQEPAAAEHKKASILTRIKNAVVTFIKKLALLAKSVVHLIRTVISSIVDKLTGYENYIPTSAAVMIEKAEGLVERSKLFSIRNPTAKDNALLATSEEIINKGKEEFEKWSAYLEKEYPTLPSEPTRDFQDVAIGLKVMQSAVKLLESSSKVIESMYLKAAEAADTAEDAAACRKAAALASLVFNINGKAISKASKYIIRIKKGKDKK